MNPKAIKVTIEYDNGLEVQSVGEHAQAFMEQADISYPGNVGPVKTIKREKLVKLPNEGALGVSSIEGVILQLPYDMREKEKSKCP